MSILMCRPDYFGIEYEINPWMSMNIQVNHELAKEQWEALLATYQRLGETVEFIDAIPGLPDLVFTANSGVVWNKRVVLSNFRHKERRGEEPHWQRWFEEHGYSVHQLPREVFFEGAGDALFLGDTMFCAHGFRSDPEAGEMTGSLLDVEVVSLKLADSRFYHLDTCFCPLNETTALYAPNAFDEESLETIKKRVKHLVAVDPKIAGSFVCNAMPLAGHLIATPSVADLSERIRATGLEPLGLPMTEYMKSGGAVRCLSLPLDLGS
jgi:N-dimethylarginine dimethylaminohydrolase